MSIRDKAMLVSLSISAWSGRKLDRTVTSEVISNHNASDDAGRFNKLLIEKSALVPVTKSITALRDYFYTVTLPYSNNGFRILPSAIYWDFVREMEKKKSHLFQQVDILLANYDTLVASRAVQLGTMFSRDDYPSSGELRRRFDVNVEINPIPEGAHFLVELGDDETDALREEIERSTSERLQAAQKDLWMRILTTVKHFAATMADGDRIFRNSTIENIRQICEIAPKMNIAGDPQLDAIVSQILGTIAKCDPDTMRENKPARLQAAVDARAAVAAIENAMACFAPVPSSV